MKPLRTIALGTLFLLLALPTAGAASAMQSVGALEFGPGDTLFVADSRGAAVYAIETGLPETAPAGEMEGV